MNHYWKLAQLQNKIPQYQRETFDIQIFFKLFYHMCVLGFLLYNWFNIDFYSMRKGSCKLLFHLFPWEKQRDDSTPLRSVELLGLNHHGEIIFKPWGDNLQALVTKIFPAIHFVISIKNRQIIAEWTNKLCCWCMCWQIYLFLQDFQPLVCIIG